MSTYADAFRSVSPAAAVAGRPAVVHPPSRIRRVSRSAFPFSGALPDDDLPPMPRNRHDALIYAARTALGGTVEW